MLDSTSGPRLSFISVPLSMSCTAMAFCCCSNGCKLYSADLDENFSVHPFTLMLLNKFSLLRKQNVLSFARRLICALVFVPFVFLGSVKHGIRVKRCKNLSDLCDLFHH